MATTDRISTSYDSAGTDSVSSFGLLVLRVAIGATALQAGLIKAFDIDAAVSFMDDNGWKMGKFAAILVTATETAGGILLLLGLLTPVAACGLIAAMIDAWAVNVAGGPFWSQPFNVPFLVAFGATALLFTGAGRLLRGREGVRPGTLARGHHGRAVRRRGCRCRHYVGLAERDQPAALRQPGHLEPTGR